VIWRVLVLWSVFAVFCYVDKTYGREVAWAAMDVLAILLLPLSAIERRLAAIAEELRRPS